MSEEQRTKRFVVEITYSTSDDPLVTTDDVKNGIQEELDWSGQHPMNVLVTLAGDDQLTLTQTMVKLVEDYVSELRGRSDITKGSRTTYIWGARQFVKWATNRLSREGA